METRGEKAAADARFEAEAEARETAFERRNNQLLEVTLTDDCPCDLERRLDPHCCAAGMCAREDE